MAKRIQVTGLNEINRNLKEVARRMKKKIKPALRDVTTYVQKESMKRTPVDKGVLMGSHRPRVTKLGQRWIGSIYVLAAYALFVHEARELVKFKSRWPRGRKFLERAITDNIDEIIRRIRRHLGEAVRKNTTIRDISTGVRGGRFYISESGRKTYVKRT